MPTPIQSVIVLGGGSAGLITALTLHAKLPQLRIRVIRSLKLGTIGVGEGTNATVPRFLHETLGFGVNDFMGRVDPIPKRGVRFIWGERAHFNFSFGPNLVLDIPGLPRPAGYYCEDGDTLCADSMGALMETNRFFLRDAQGRPRLDGLYGYHFENEKLVAYLEQEATARGLDLVDDELQQAVVGEQGIEELRLASGATAKADLYVDASGFQSELLGKALGEPFESFKSSLFCERAVVGKWERTSEPVNAYTTAENMEAGWCWQIEHRHAIARGYVYAPDFISDEQAEAEFRRKNPKITQTRVVKFTSGRRRRQWVKNVVAVGNASGFVEPLEATALAVICEQAHLVARCLADSNVAPPPSMQTYFNRHLNASWDSIRWFLAVHYKFNTKFDTPFWRAARTETDIGPMADLVAFYQENGPSHLGAITYPAHNFPLSAYWTHLVGMQVPYANRPPIAPSEHRIWREHLANMRRMAEAGVAFQELPRP